jgi:hypothetical protein
MKKIAALLASFLLLTIALHAQKKQPAFFAEFGVGPSFPIGNFSKKTYNGTDNNLPGFATTGLGVNLSFGYHLNESVGLLLSGGYSINPQDEQAYVDYFKSNNSNIYTASVDAKSWKIAKLMAGGFLVTPLTSAEDLVLRTKLTAGVCKTAIPELKYGFSGENNNLGSIWWREYGYQGKTALPWTFCYQVSVGLKYTLNKKLYALFDISSFNATAEKENYFYYSTGVSVGTGPNGTNTPPKRKFKLATVNAQAGIGLSF